MVVNFVETEASSVVARGLRKRNRESVCNGCGVSVGENEVLWMDGGDDFTVMCVSLILSCTKNG